MSVCYITQTCHFIYEHKYVLCCTDFRETYKCRTAMFSYLLHHRMSHKLVSIFTTLLHSVVCLTTGPQPLTKRVLHTVRSSASAFNLQYSLVSLTSSITTYVFFLVFPSLLSRLLPLLQLCVLEDSSYTRCDQSN